MISKAWVAHARSLAETLAEHEPDVTLSVLIVDPIEGFIDPADELFEVVEPEDLDLEDFPAMSVRYDVTELCRSLKPSLMKLLLATGKPVVYLDSDVRLYAPLDGLKDALSANPFLLVPHLLEPIAEDGREPDELAILVAGSFNLGFAAARATAEVEALLKWWAARLRTGSRLDAANAMVYDQRWADLMPGLFAAAGLWRDPGVNFGYWRAGTAQLKRDPDGKVLVGGSPLRTVHFSGFDAEHPEHLSTYENRVALEREPVLRELVEDFFQQLISRGHAEASAFPYGFAKMAGGAALTSELRDLWDRAAREGAVSEPPFTAAGERAFLSWLAEPEYPQHGEPLNRYLLHLHRARVDLRERFADVLGEDREAFLAWAKEQSERHPGEVLGLLCAGTKVAAQPGLRALSPGETLGAGRGEAVVCIPVYGACELFVECMVSVLAHTPEDVRILIADDASPDPAIERFVESLAAAGRLDRHDVAYLRQPENLGFPANANAAFAAAAPADVVLLNSDCVVDAGWFSGLRRAACSDALVATASALTNHGTILSLPYRNRPQTGLPQDKLLSDAASAVLAQSLRIFPRLPTAVGHCVYVRRQALDLVGAFDQAFSPGYGEEVDFSQRCLLHGLVHVAADDVFVLHQAGGSLSSDGKTNPVQKAHEAIIESRYPYYQRAQTDAGKAKLGPLARAMGSARRAMTGLRVTVDARSLGPFMTGTQVHTLEVIRALSHTQGVGLRVIVQPDIGGYAQEQLAQMGGIEVIPHTEVHPTMEKTDIAHRPFQVSNANDLLMLSCAGERTVITHQDLIAYRNPGYFPGYPQWERYRRLTRQALASADRVVFFSHHAADDAANEDLLEPDRVQIVYIGVDHAHEPAQPEQPRGVEALGEAPMLLCLGTDFRHKNRLFAIRLLEALRESHNWEGSLVLAGPRVSYGSSAGEEARYLATHPELAARVVYLPAVSEGEKRWLIERSSAVLYPTTYEGFGLMPFEAAALGRPCLFASQTALAETLPATTATLIPWDTEASAARVLHLLDSPTAAAAQVNAIRRAGERFTWRSTGEALLETYRIAAASPARVASQLALDLARVEIERDESERKYEELWTSLTPEARSVLNPESGMDPEELRSLMAVRARPLARRLLFGSLHWGRRIRGAPRGGHEHEPRGDPEAFDLHFGPSNETHMRELTARVDTQRLIQEP